MKPIIVYLSLILSVVCLSLFVYNQNKKSIKYIETGRLYEEFLLSKDLNQKLDVLVKTKQVAIDTLLEKLKRAREVLQLQKGKTIEDVAKVAKMEESYLARQEMNRQENEKVAAEYNTKIWSQINQYLKEYGEKEGIDFILGATGQGGIMHANPDLDITEQLIKYVNARYEGKLEK